MSVITPSAAVAEEVRAWMARKRISQTAVADHLEISQSSMSRRLAGQQPFTVDELYKLAALFEIAPSKLLGDTEAAAS